MTSRPNIASGLLDLPAWSDRSVRQAVFRQSLAQLALAANSDAPGPLDGVHPERLLQAVVTAREDGFLDDLDFLAPDAASVGLYELASALPLGPERRDLGRRVLAQLYEGNARTFVAIASRMAATSSRALGGAGARARIALAVHLPRWADVPADALALALASRRDLSRTWIGTPSTGSLPERRLAARMLERAAREIARRAQQGDPSGLRLFRHAPRAAAQRRHFDLFADPIAGAWHRLLTDRESLVWRHVATARGLLAPVMPELGDEVRDLLDPSLSATEWRRGATSLVASIATDPERSVRAVLDLLRGPLLLRDPGIASAMVWGMGPAAEAEPEAAEEALDALVAASPISVAEALVDLRADLVAPGATTGFGDAAIEACMEALGVSLSSAEADEGLAALGRAVLVDLAGESADGLRPAIARAFAAFIDEGARAAHSRAVEALTHATEIASALLAFDPSPQSPPSGARRMAHRTSVRLLRELDGSLFESTALKWLLLLDRRPSDDTTSSPALEDVHDRLGAWLLAAETTAPDDPAQITLHTRQLRALLHIIDGEANDNADDFERVQRVRASWMKTSSALLTRLARDRKSGLRRAIAATVARAFDALARDGAADPADILLYASVRVPDADDLDVLAEASVEPDVAELLRVYALFVRHSATVLASAKERSPDPTRVQDHLRSPDNPADLLAPLEGLSSDFPVGASPRIEVLRNTLVQILRGLEAVRAAQSLGQIAAAASSQTSPLASIDDALTRLAHLVLGARRRCGDDTVRDIPSSSFPSLHALVIGMLGGPRSDADAPRGRSLHARLVAPTLFAWTGNMTGVIPTAIADITSAVLGRIATLPAEQPEPVALPLSQAPLPLWLPTRRILGGFYIHRQIGGGALGTVFVVTRAEDRNNPSAERFALKVPDYDATAARSVSEAEFLRMFRLEAGALLSVPDHRNVARFVTFDAGARPKPILVMELVEGTRLDQVLSARALDMPRALALLDGVLAGLEAMHGAGVGHLDVKPSNVILRSNGDPVLVDFGLAGRHLRPGCGTGCYCAPEVWGVLPKGGHPTPMTADVYSFGCFAYEVLTTHTLFGGMSDAALISAHLTHDGVPPPVRKLAENRRTATVAAFLVCCLRQNPSQRASVTDLRKELHARAPELAQKPWPLEA